MNVRKFTAPQVKDALAQVRRALGEDAVILRTRKVRKGGLLSFLHRDLVEVTAATPDPKPTPSGETRDHAAQVKSGLAAQVSAHRIRDLRDELTDLNHSVRELSEQMKFERMPSLPQHLADRYKDMVRAGLDENLAKELTQKLNLKFAGAALEDAGLVDRELGGMLEECIPVRRPARHHDSRASVVALVGPTGVGKTTTMAKLVTSYRFWGKMDTALVSADTYRVAALEQLRTFASIAGLPMETVYQPTAMTNVLARHRERDAIFIDTPGRSQADGAKLDELAEFLNIAQPDEVLLCLSVSVRLEDQMDIIARYRVLNPTGIIYTKLDESTGPGLIPSALSHAGLPLCYLTCGQNVPEDILAADARRLSSAIVHPERLAELQSSHFQDWKAAEKNSREASLA